jgi:hypothetical protein
MPLIPKEKYLDQWPVNVVTYSERNSRLVISKANTALCFYTRDHALYPRLEKVNQELQVYRAYQGVIGLDITVTADMDLEWQKETMLLNQLFTAVLAYNDIKVIANTRCGNLNTLEYLDCIPHGVMCASSTLGCTKNQNPADYTYLQKILRLQPSKLLLYGKRDTVIEDQLERLGITYRRFNDVHTQHREYTRQLRNERPRT